MNRQLRERRNRAAERHDAALARYPSREGDVFTCELQWVVNELREVAEAADDPSSDPVEVSKTYRWLGDASFDLARGKEVDTLTRGAQAYQRSEELLANAETPVERAKLDFNYANTLRGLSAGVDVGLLEAAQTRYERATRAFRMHHLPDLAATVEQQLRSLDPQLRLVRKDTELQRGYGRLEQMQERLKGAGPAERERIARELQDLSKVPAQGDASDALDEALDAIREQYEQNPERFRSGDATKINSLQDQIQSLTSMLERATPEEAPSAGGQDREQEIMRALTERLKGDATTGRVSADRAAQLGEILEQFGAAMKEGGEDLDSLATRTHKMKELTKRVMDAGMTPSWGTPEPQPESHAGRLLPIFESLKRHLLAEKGRSMLPSEEAAAGTDLLMRLVKLEARVREAGAEEDQDRVAGLEGEAWRLAVDVHEYGRRYHLVLAQPDFAMGRKHARPKSVFLSGSEELHEVAKSLAKRDDLMLFADAGRGDLAQGRWNQLCSASVGVFDLGVPEGSERAQVCYELGLALALGKPSVVVADPRQRLPFDVNLKPIRLSGAVAARVESLDHAIRDALGSIEWGGYRSEIGSAPSDALSWLHQCFGPRLTDGAIRIAVDMAERSRQDAVAFRRALEHLLGMLGADAPAILLSAWPPVYPQHDQKPRCFHVMPFRPDWSRPTRDLAEDMCRQKGWIYSRGDEAEAQRIIYGIWSEIGSASAVIVDITDHNPNVALELGVVHALGRPYRVIAQGDAEKHMFPSLEKVQIHSYAPSPPFSKFRDIVRNLLESVES